jgi:tetratricopeptide (TPR) repeat protein
LSPLSLHCAGWVLALLAMLLGARPQEPRSDAQAARELLERAGDLKGRLFEVRGREREALRRRVVEAYRAVRQGFPAEKAAVAEASFRAGELLRSSGSAGEARAEFELARAAGAGTPFRARAGLELGHLARRAELHEDALARYREVLSDEDCPAQQRDQAWLWAGRACAELGRAAEARELLRRAAERAQDPCDRVEAYDALALAWIAAGDLEAAAGELARCREALRDAALEATPSGARVRSALVNLRAVERLKRAIASRRAGLSVER